MSHQPVRLGNIFAGIVVVGILSALLLPRICPPNCPKVDRCGGNLGQLYQLGLVYASAHQGKWPDATGSALWLSFAKTTPPLIPPEEPEVLWCSVYGENQ